MTTCFYPRLAVSGLVFTLLLGFTMSCSSSVGGLQDRSGFRVLSIQLIKENELRQEDLKQIQFFLGSELRFVGSTQKRTIAMPDNKLSLADTTVVETINVKPMTPGIVTKVDRAWLAWFYDGPMEIAVCFVEKDTLCDDEYLIFKPDRSGYFKLYSQHWNGVLPYGTREYQCLIGCTNNFLYYDESAMARVIRRSRTLPGRRFKKLQKSNE